MSEDWPRVVKLTVPVQLSERSEVITQLTFRRGRFGDLKGVKLGSSLEADSMLLVASRMSGQPLGVLEALDADDAGEVSKIVTDFFGKCLGAGSVASPS